MTAQTPAEQLTLTSQLLRQCMEERKSTVYLELVRRSTLKPKCPHDQINIWMRRDSPHANVISVTRMGDNWWTIRCVASRKAVLEYAIEREAELLKLEGVA
jgi:hypothetical protein